jgi:hypothetical protein
MTIFYFGNEQHSRSPKTFMAAGIFTVLRPR